MAQGSTQPLTEISASCNNSLGVKDGRCLGFTTFPPSCADCLEIWEPHPPGTLYRDYVTVYIFESLAVFFFKSFSKIIRREIDLVKFAAFIIVYMVLCFVFFCLIL